MEGKTRLKRRERESPWPATALGCIADVSYDAMTSIPDYRDILISDLADSEAALRECLRGVIADRDAYRLIAQQAIHALHDLRQRDNARECRYLQLLDEARELRAGRQRAA